jgi:hypothetical protein
MGTEATDVPWDVNDLIDAGEKAGDNPGEARGFQEPTVGFFRMK